MLDALTLDQMRIFVCVAEEGSFSAAARKLGRVQSAISQSIKTMETTLRLELFERDGKTPRVTPAGAALLREALDILNDVDAFKRRAQSISSGFAPQLTLAVDQVFLQPGRGDPALVRPAGVAGVRTGYFSDPHDIEKPAAGVERMREVVRRVANRELCRR